MAPRSGGAAPRCAPFSCAAMRPVAAAPLARYLVPRSPHRQCGYTTTTDIRGEAPCGAITVTSPCARVPARGSSWQPSPVAVQRRGLISQDKGQRTMVGEFIEAVRRGGPGPIPYVELAAVTEATLCILESLRESRSVALGERSRSAE